MEDLLPLIQAYAIPTVMALVGVAVVVIGAGLTLSRPMWLTLVFLLVLFVESGSTYGGSATSRPIYGRGSGQLPLTFWQLGLLGSLFWSVVSAKLGNMRGSDEALTPKPSYVPWAWGFTVLLVGHLLVGLILGVKHEQILWAFGFSEFVWMSVVMGLVIATVRTPEQLDFLMKFIVVAGSLRALFGLARFAIGGGDPTNIYAIEGTVPKLTFFDIPESLVSTLAAVIALYRLLADDRKVVAGLWRWIYIGASALCVANVVFSYRRSAWGGLVLSLAVLMLFLPRQRRIQFALLGAPLVLAAVGYTAYQRLDRWNTGNFLQMFLFDMISPDVGEESSRTLELKLAFESFIGSPLFGTGAWGHYSDASLIDWQTGEVAGAFLHSGPLHLALKAGVVGLALLAGFLWASLRAAFAAARIKDPTIRVAAVAGLAGMVFAGVDFAISPPYGRMQQLTGLCLALPYVALTVSRMLAKESEKVTVLPPVASTPVPGAVPLPGRPLVQPQRALARH